MKQLLTVGQVRRESDKNDNKCFIMGDHGQLPDTPYYNNYRDCMIEILKMAGKRYTNIYDMSEANYHNLTN